jgi:hypothetical protein
MSKQTFTATLEAADRGGVRLPIPFQPTEVWGKKRRHFVKGLLGGTRFEGSLGVREGRYFFPVNEKLRESANVGIGDRVKVVIEPAPAHDSALPMELEKALTTNAKARAFFESLSPFYRNTFGQWVADAKKEATREQRIRQVVELLVQGKKQR